MKYTGFGMVNELFLTQKLLLKTVSYNILIPFI